MLLANSFLSVKELCASYRGGDEWDTLYCVGESPVIDLICLAKVIVEEKPSVSDMRCIERFEFARS